MVRNHIKMWQSYRKLVALNAYPRGSERFLFNSGVPDLRLFKKQKPALTTYHLFPHCCCKIEPRSLLLASDGRVLNLIMQKISTLVNSQANAQLTQDLRYVPILVLNHFLDSTEVEGVASFVQFFSMLQAS